MSPSWTQGVCPHATFPIGYSVATDKAMLDYVMATPNAIGYPNEIKERKGRRDVGIKSRD